MNQTKNTIDFYMHVETAQTLLHLLQIANKAHAFNPSPVDIKRDLAKLPSATLMQAEQDLKERIKEQSKIYEQGTGNELPTQGN